MTIPVTVNRTENGNDVVAEIFDAVVIALTCVLGMITVIAVS